MEQMWIGGLMESINVELFGNDPKVKNTISMARNIAVTKASVLIIGEPGTGKKTLGYYIHLNSSRAKNPFVIVDCIGERKEVENAILGFREDSGKFHRGALEAANGGTVLFSNIDALEDDFQKRLHKIIMELEDYDLDVRILATTSKNLSKLVGAGRFYRGLYTYISNDALFIPPLRERTNDLEWITKKLISQFCENTEIPMEIEPLAMEKILGHYWTYNLAELRTVIENSVKNSNQIVLSEKDLEMGEKKAVNLVKDEDNIGIRLMSLKDAEKLLIKKALIHTSENRTQAAKILGVSIRTLRNKINEYRTRGSAFFLNLR